MAGLVQGFEHPQKGLASLGKSMGFSSPKGCLFVCLIKKKLSAVKSVPLKTNQGKMKNKDLPFSTWRFPLPVRVSHLQIKYRIISPTFFFRGLKAQDATSSMSQLGLRFENQPLEPHPFGAGIYVSGQVTQQFEKTLGGSVSRWAFQGFRMVFCCGFLLETTQNGAPRFEKEGALVWEGMQCLVLPT